MSQSARSENPYAAAPSDFEPRRNWRTRIFLGILCLALLVVWTGCVGFAGWLIGGMAGQSELYERQFVRERDELQPVIDSDPRFRQVRIGQYSGGGIVLSGQVDSSDDRAALQEELVRLFGERRANELIYGVDVRADAAP